MTQAALQPLALPAISVAIEADVEKLIKNGHQHIVHGITPHLVCSFWRAVVNYKKEPMPRIEKGYRIFSGAVHQ